MAHIEPSSDDRIRVHWTNPVTQVRKIKTFGTSEEADRYIAGRFAKYGEFEGFLPPVKEESHG